MKKTTAAPKKKSSNDTGDTWELYPIKSNHNIVRISLEDLRRKSFKSIWKTLREELSLIHRCSIGIGNGYIMEHSAKAIEHFFQLNSIVKKSVLK